MASIRDCENWFELWCDCRLSTIENMVRNMSADLNAGYDYFGVSITNQRKQIEEYKNKYDEMLDMFKFMNEKEVNRWCFYDMKKRGDID